MSSSLLLFLIALPPLLRLIRCFIVNYVVSLSALLHIPLYCIVSFALFCHCCTIISSAPFYPTLFHLLHCVVVSFTFSTRLHQSFFSDLLHRHVLRFVSVDVSSSLPPLRLLGCVIVSFTLSLFPLLCLLLGYIDFSLLYRRLLCFMFSLVANLHQLLCCLIDSFDSSSCELRLLLLCFVVSSAASSCLLLLRPLIYYCCVLSSTIVVCSYLKRIVVIWYF